MKRVISLAIGVATLGVVGGCGVVQNLLDLIGQRETGSPELKGFASEQDLLDYFKTQVGAQNQNFAVDEVRGDGAGGGEGAEPVNSVGDDAAVNTGNGPSPPSTAPTDSADGDHSQTTTQEEGVDESDVVKTDGDYLYVIDSSWGDTSTLRMVQVNVDPIQAAGEATIEGYGRDIYLMGDMVVAITSGGGIYYMMDGVAGVDGGMGMMRPSAKGQTAQLDSSEPVAVETDDSTATDISIAPIDVDGDGYAYQRPFTAVTVVDVTDRAAPRIVSATRFDGTQVASRMIDGVLHLVLANYQTYYFDVMPMMGRSGFSTEGLMLGDMLPNYVRTEGESTTASGDLVTWENLYRPTDPDGFGVVTVVSVDIDNNAAFQAVGIVAEPGLIYSSLNALYLTDTNWDFAGNQRTTTDIYKFAYTDRGATATATGSVPGRVLNQYSMGEHEGNLRVATTIDQTFVFDFVGNFGVASESQNNVYVLSQPEGANSLTVVGSLENVATGETIQSARFVGNRGYLVTFEQTDPLFTLYLSDAANPRIVGELEVPGFSTFLVPMDENHLLAVGQYVPPPDTFGAWGVQISIFDVTDFANPTRTANVILGEDTGAYSEAQWDPKAFTYFADQGLVALPLSIYGGPIFVEEIDGDADAVGGSTDSGGAAGGTDGSAGTGDVVTTDPPTTTDTSGASTVDQGFEGLVVFRVSAEERLTELGRISTWFDEAAYYYPSFTRGVFVGSKVYAVTNLGVHGATRDDLTTIQDELFFGLPDFGDDAVTIEPELMPVEGTGTTDVGVTIGSSGS